MNVIQEKKDDILVLKPEGRIDSGTSGEFEASVFKFIDNGEKKLVFDFAGIDFVSSAGLRSFLIFAKRLKKKEGRLALYSMNENIREIFEMTGFTGIIPIFATENEAVKNISDIS
jgi:anti-sigma B factor antagonist